MNSNGLTDEEVIKNREKYGCNVFSKKEQDSFFKLLLETFSDPIIKILLIALGIKTIFLIKDFDWYETIGIVIAILVASLISSISEYGSMRAFNKLTEETAKINVRVKRNGQVIEIPIGDVVVNDIVLLKTGDKIPADGIIVSGNIAVDESMMNGESKEIDKKIDGDNNVYMGTVVYSGNAKMLVKNVGDSTFYGKIASELQSDDTASPLKIRLSKLANDISKIGYVCSILVALSYLLYMVVISNNFDMNLIIKTIHNGREMMGYILDALTLCVSIIVVSVPEGLPMMITLVLSSNMKRMLKNNVLVRKLVGIETAGNINVLFTDKTGTLTSGKLEVIGFLDGNGNSLEYSNMNNQIKNLFNMSMVINNESVYDKNCNKVVGGNITDRAILEYVKEYKNDYTILKQEAFNSSNKYMYTKIKHNGHTINLVKGAYEVIGKMCNTYYDKYGNKHSFNGVDLDSKLKKISSNMIRVIALAMNNDRETTNNMTLVGFIMLKDEIRENVVLGIDLVRKAGIQSVMITGDNKETATSVAREIGLISSNDIILTHDKLMSMSDEEIMKDFYKIKVIARAMPQDKSRLVDIAKKMNLVVGMTGDGVNDALALKKADVGFAMGSGTEVAKEAADIVILDDNYYSIINAILYGRTIFKSIRKFIICQLTINFCSLCVSIIGPFIGIPVPITVVQMLWINMIMDTLSGFAFSYEPALLEYMEEKPKKKDENIINKYMLNQIIITGLFSASLCIFFLKSRLTNILFNDSIMTAFFGLIIFISILNSFSARTHRLNILANITKNRVFIVVITFVTLMQIYLIYYGGEVFRTSGLSIKEFIIMFFFSLLVIPVEFIRKIILKINRKELGV